MKKNMFGRTLQRDAPQGLDTIGLGLGIGNVLRF
jgi:hypothetical protein